MNKKWRYLPAPPEEKIQKLKKLLHISTPTSRLLLQRGIDDFKKAKAFFNPSLDQLHDPLQMKGMKGAIQRLQRAIEAKEHIRIYGDYDVDGTTSVALAYQVLQKLGAHVSYYIPDRYTEGYGLSMQGIQKAIQEKVNLLICVDCGTRAIEAVRYAKKHSIDILICDHHEPSDLLPQADSLLNPKQKDCPYPFKELSACGIVFKLFQGFFQVEKEYSLDLSRYLDLLALSIAADIVPILDENRVLAALGVQQLNVNPSMGLAVLKELTRPSKELTISDIVFGLAPPINAAGRLQHAHNAVALLISKERREALSHARYLQAQNQKRKKMDQELAEKALTMIMESPSSSCTHVLYHPDWSKGLVGIGAARCIEHHYKPTILLTRKGDMAVGSARSIQGYNIYEALTACKDLLHKYGGHAYAAGLALPIDHLEAFREAFEKHATTLLSPEHLISEQIIDLPIHLNQITDAFVGILERMRPFGPGNRSPVFVTAPVVAIRHCIYQDKHLKLWIQEEKGGKVWEAIGFQMAKKRSLIEGSQPFSMAYKVEQQFYQEEARNQLILKDLKPYEVIVSF